MKIKLTFPLTSPTVALYDDSTSPDGIYRSEVIQWVILDEGTISGVVRGLHGDEHGSWRLELADEATNFLGYVDGKP